MNTANQSDSLTGTSVDMSAELACLAPAGAAPVRPLGRWRQSRWLREMSPALRKTLIAVGFSMIAFSLLWPAAGDNSRSASAETGRWLALVLPKNALADNIASGPQRKLVQESDRPERAQPAALAEQKIDRWKKLTVTPGDTLASLFKQVGLGAGDVHRIVNHDAESKALTRIFPGQIIDIRLDEKGQFTALGYNLPNDRRLRITQTADGLTSEVDTLELDLRLNEASSWIHDSLFVAGQRAGLSDNLIMQLAEIFGWDIDFVLDIRAGDHFSVLYQEVYRDGVKIRDGQILAAAFTNRNNTFRAVRYENSAGNVEYFSPEGRNMRKAFLRSPVDFSRISSRFSYARKHPVLKGVTRPHRGVDYAAGRGTPVKSTGDGKIIYRNRNRSYGNHIIVQHGSQYQTLYAHLSKFNRKAKKGSRVRQGQIVGYVGATGLANGPHLHYEFRVNGVHKNPLKVKFPKADPLPKKEMALFSQATKNIRHRLDLVDQSLLASKAQP